MAKGMPGPPLGGTSASLTMGLVRRACSGSGPMGSLVSKANGMAEGQLTVGLPLRGPAPFPRCVERYTGRHTAGWCRPGGWGAAWRRPAGTR